MTSNWTPLGYNEVFPMFPWVTVHQQLDDEKFHDMCSSDNIGYYHNLKQEIARELRKQELEEDIADISFRRLAKKRAIKQQVTALEIPEAMSVFHRWTEKVAVFGDLSTPNTCANLLSESLNPEHPFHY